MSTDVTQRKSPNLTIISYVCFTFIGYLVIGLTLAVLPVFIHQTLGYNTLIAGIVISLQYFSTILFRGYAGKIVDSKGPKIAVRFSMLMLIISGLGLCAAYSLRSSPALSLALLVLTRLLTGCAEGLVGASPINWAIMALGPQHTAKAISFNGIASYGAMAIGAPLGVMLVKWESLYSLSLLIVIVGLIGFLYVRKKTNLTGQSKAAAQSFYTVFKKVAPFGLCLALGGIGFGSISTFMTLYYAHFNWVNGALCLSVFGLMFILARLVFNRAISNYGGLRVGIVSLLIETIGLMIIWIAQDPMLTLVGAGITGLGFSLVFPALGVEAIKTVNAANQGAALASYGLFIDLSLGITGPLIGAVATHWGMSNIFLFALFLVGIGFLMTLLLNNKSTSPRLAQHS